MSLPRSKAIADCIYKNPVLFMITGAIFGFISALLIFFFENIPGMGGDALKPIEIPIKIAGHPNAVRKIETIGMLNSLPEFFTWIMLFTIHNSIAIALGLAAFQKLKSFNLLSIGKTEISISLFLVLVMMVISSTSYIIPFDSGKYYNWPVIPLNHQWLKIIILLAISITAAGISVLGLILSACACIKLATEDLANDAVQSYFRLKESIERFLMITGYILSSGMITVYFFMATEKSLNKEKTFDIHSLTLFGLLFTIFIAITFIPCKLLLTDFGRSIVNKQLGKPPRGTDKLKAWIETSEEMEKYLQLKFDAVETLRYAIPVLAPILSSFLPGIFKH